MPMRDDSTQKALKWKGETSTKIVLDKPDSFRNLHELTGL